MQLLLYNNSRKVYHIANRSITLNPEVFNLRVRNWHDLHGRKNLPWQRGSPYHVWVSEIMLQQTQVKTVVPYFNKFVLLYESIAQLANAQLDEVLSLWSGLGYYSRARNLHSAAREVMSHFNGELPAQIEVLEKLPGIGRSTAAAIMSMGFNKPAAILDGNVKRVLARFFGIGGWPGTGAVNKELWQKAELLASAEEPAKYSQGMMDIGALVCTRQNPSCKKCPLNTHCEALLQGSVHSYPGKRAKKIIPIRNALFFLFIERYTCEILLEKRADKGIWAGLWSLPEHFLQHIPTRLSDAMLACFDDTVSEKSVRLSEPFRHKFTHFHLNILPVIVTGKKRISTNTKNRWHHFEKALQLGLPSPVRKIIKNIYSAENFHTKSIF